MGLPPAPIKQHLVPETIHQPRNNGLSYSGNAPGNTNGQRTLNNGIRLATWNVRTLHTPGAFDILIKEAKRYRLDVVAIQEVRWIGDGTMVSDVYKLIYGGTNQHAFGTAFLIRSCYSEAIKGYSFLSDRLSSLHLRGQFNDIILINGHAPTENAEEEQKDDFFDLMDEVLNKCPNYATKIILGDMNAKIGRDQQFHQITGKHSLHYTSNDNGQKLIQFAMAHGMIIKSTMLCRKDIHKATWISPDNRTRNQIDHVIIDKRRGSLIEDVRTFRGADINSDHLLVIIRVKQRIRRDNRNGNKRKPKIGIENLKFEEFQLQYNNNLDQKLNEQQLENPDIETRWQYIKQSILDASECLGEEKKEKNKKRKGKKKRTKCSTSLKKRNEYRMKALTTPNSETRERYKKQRRETKALFRKKKREKELENLNLMEVDGQNNNIRSFYQRVKKSKKVFTSKTETIKNTDGKTLFNKEEILNRWKEYFSNLLNVENNNTIEEVVTDTAEIYIPEPTQEEVRNAIRKLKNNKAVGNDNIPSELIKKGTLQLEYEITELVKQIWKDEKIPQDWNEAIIIPILKKGDKEVCSNYRGISLLNSTYKILSIIVLDRLKPYTEELIEDYQTGFMRSKSTVDQIFSLRQLLERRYEFGKETHLMFVDFKKAFDCLHRQAIFNAMVEMGIPKKLVQIVKTCMTKTNNKVRSQNGETELFETVSGVKQGDGLSPVIFNLALQYALKKVLTNDLTTLGLSHFQILAYADDIAILGENTTEIQRCVAVLEAETKKIGLEINKEKTEYMIAGRHVGNLPQTKEVNGHLYKVVDKFKYLGTTINKNNSIEEEILIRLANANKSYFALNTIFKNKYLSRKSKIRILKTVILPVLLYGSEAWPLTKQIENKLQSFENKILRRIFGPIRDEITGLWRIRKNEDIWNLYNEPLVRETVRRNIMRWAGHVARVDQNRIIYRTLHLNYNQPRKRGRPRKRWIDGVRKWYGEAKPPESPENWEEFAKDRTSWRNLVYRGFGPPRPVSTL